MLATTAPSTPWIIALALLALIVLLVVRAIRKDKREYQRFKKFTSTDLRQKMMRKWVLQSFTVFGGATIVLLALAANFVPLMLDDINAWAWIAAARQAFASGPLWPTIVAAAVVTILAVTVLAIFAARKETTIPALGDVHALLPRNRSELAIGAALSVNAGVVEELLFRLAIPTAIFAVTRNAPAAILLSVALFGALHIYQGIPGVIGSTIAGLAFFAIFIASNNIVVAIVVHALFDLRSLVLIPVIVFGVHKKHSAPA